MVNLEPVRLQAGNLLKLPPLFDTYTHPPPSIPLVAKGTTGPVLATIEGESSHGPVQDPTFSIAAGGMLEPATGWLVPRPNTEGLSRSGLGLVDGDELKLGVRARRDLDYDVCKTLRRDRGVVAEEVRLASQAHLVAVRRARGGEHHHRNEQCAAEFTPAIARRSKRTGTGHG
jgi:hypothetical protein